MRTHLKNLQWSGTPVWALFLIVALIMVATHPVQAKMADSDRYVFSNLADQVMPSVVTVHVKLKMKAQHKNLSPEDRERMDDFLRRFFGEDPDLDEFFKRQDSPPGEGEGQDEGDEDDEDSWTYPSASGSGVIVSEDGYILTNHHVISNRVGKAESDNIEIEIVLHDGSKIENDAVEIVDSHSLSDLALLKIDRKGLQYMKWGDSEALRIGERVAALGSPLNLRETITQGIVCAKGRGMGLAGMIQTDAVINPGSSGGALVNMDGELVGINRLISTNTGRWQGYGFAIPSNDAHRFFDQIMTEGRVRYGYIGVMMGSPLKDTPETREALGLDKDLKGVLVVGVPAGGPAEKAGVQIGDFIVGADDETIERDEDLLRYVARQDVGSTIRLKILRSDEDREVHEKTLKVKVAERDEQKIRDQFQPHGRRGPQTPDEEEKTGILADLGLRVERSDDPKGVRIEQVRPRSTAWRAGLRDGDVILEIDKQRVKDPGALEKVFEKGEKDDVHWMIVERAGRRQMVTIKGK